MTAKDFLELDGSQGEGGGQVLRTALTLSMLTGTAFHLSGIRARRDKPGLLRQHLTAVQAAAAISGARVEGAEIGSGRLSFQPGTVRAGDYHFAIGSAGSCTLVLQTLLPALWLADSASTVTVSGGTHNKAAPPADFLIRAWMPLMARMGVRQTIALARHGFYPAGGGKVVAQVDPVAKLHPLQLSDRGALLGLFAEARVAAVSEKVARRELARARARLGSLNESVRELPDDEGPGNVLLIEVCHQNVTEMFTGFGERGVTAETVADRAAGQARRYLASDASVGEHLADQLLLPMAIAGGGVFTTLLASSHLQTNSAVIEKFLPVEIVITEQNPSCFRVEVR